MTSPYHVINPPVVQEPQQGGGLPLLLQVLQESAQRKQRQQELLTQYGQLKLEQDKFAEETKQRNEKKKGAEQMAEALKGQLGSTQMPGLFEGAAQTGDPAMLQAAGKMAEAVHEFQHRSDVQKQFTDINARYQGKTDIQSQYLKHSEMLAADPENSGLANVVSTLSAQLGRTKKIWRPVISPLTGKAYAFDEETGTYKDSGVVIPPKPTGSTGQQVVRIQPRLEPFKIALSNMTKIENADPQAVDEVAKALASNRVQIGKFNVGQFLGWIRGYAFKPAAKKYAMFTAVAMENLLGMQFNVRANMQVELWQQGLLPMVHEAYEKDPLHARQAMRDIMAKGYEDTLNAAKGGKQPADTTQQRYKPNNPFTDWITPEPPR